MAVTPTGYTPSNETSGSSSVNVAIPPGASAGDYAMASWTTNQSTVGLITPPSGDWATRVSHLIGGTSVVLVCTKFLTDADITAGSFTFATADGDTRTWAGGLRTWSGVDPTTPIHAEAIMSADVNAATFTSQALTTTIPDAFVVFTAHWTSGSTASTVTPASPLTEVWDLQHPTLHKRGNEFAEVQLGAAVTNTTYSATKDDAVSSAFRCHVFALTPAAAEPPPALDTQRLNPTSLVESVGIATGALADISEDPTAPDAAWMNATEPTAGGTTTDPTIYLPAATAEAYPGFTGCSNLPGALAPRNYASLDTSAVDTALVAYGSPGKNTYLGVLARDMNLGALVPADATIDEIWMNALVRNTAAANATNFNWICQPYFNGALWGGKSTASVSNNTVGRGGQWVAWRVQIVKGDTTTTFTQAEARAADFGWAVRFTRTQNTAYTFYIDGIGVELVYTVAGSTVPVRVRVALLDPSRALEPGGQHQKVRAFLRPRGVAGAPARLEVLEAGSNVVLATAATGVAVDTVAGEYVEGTFDAAVLAAVSGTNLEVAVATDGIAGGTMDVGAIDVLAGLSTVTTNYINGVGLARARALMQGAVSSIRGGRATTDARALMRAVSVPLRSAPARSEAPGGTVGRAVGNLLKGAAGITRSASGVNALANVSRFRDAPGESKSASGANALASVSRIREGQGISGGRARATGRPNAILSSGAASGGRTTITGVGAVMGLLEAPALARGRSQVFGRPAILLTSDGAVSRGASAAPAAASARATAPGRVEAKAGVVHARGGLVRNTPGLARGRGLLASRAAAIFGGPALTGGLSAASAVAEIMGMESAPAIAVGRSNVIARAAATIASDGAISRAHTLAVARARGDKSAPATSRSASGMYAGGAGGLISNGAGLAQSLGAGAVGRVSPLKGAGAHSSPRAMVLGRAAITIASGARSGGFATMRGYAELIGLESSPALAGGRADVYARAAVIHAGKAHATPRTLVRATAIRLVPASAISQARAHAMGRGGLMRMATATSMSMSLTTATAAVSKVSGAPAISTGRSKAQAWAQGLKGIGSLSPIVGRTRSWAWPGRIRNAGGALSSPRANVHGRAQGVKDAPGVSRATATGRARASKLINASAVSAGLSQVRGRATYIAGNRGTVSGRTRLTGRPSRLTGTTSARSGGRAFTRGLPTIAKPGIDAPGLARGRADATARAMVVRGGKGLVTSGSQALALAQPLRAARAISRGTTHISGRPGALRASGGVITMGSDARGRATYIVASPGASIGFAIVVGPGDIIESVYPITIPGGKLSHRLGGGGTHGRIVDSHGVLGGSRIIGSNRTSKLGGGR